jgi:hypothetical protein
LFVIAIEGVCLINDHKDAAEELAAGSAWLTQLKAKPKRK